MMRGLLLAALMSMACAGAAHAQTCIGIEWRVNQQTMALDTAVAGQVGTSQGALLGLEEINRARLLSAVKVMTKQQSASTDQALLTERQAAEAAASAYVAQRQAYGVMDAKTRYSSTGYGACGVGVKASTFATALRQAPQRRRAIMQGAKWAPNTYGSPADWIGAASRQNGVFNASSLFGGNATEAGNYIGFVMGPPDAPPPPGQSAAATGASLEKGNRDALKSTAAYVMSSIASDFEAGGPIEKMRAMSNHWLGQDGGEAWSANMAAAPERGVLQDAVRIEAANLVSQAYALKSNSRQEAGLAAMLLARINVMLGVPPGAPRGGRP